MVARHRRWSSALLAWLVPAAAASAAVSVGQLRTEYRTDPLAVDTDRPPRLQWVLAESDPAVRGQRQTAYQIRAASGPATLDAADLWDSGKIASDQQNQIPYGGHPVGQGRPCWWQVRVWDKDGQPSAWSDPAVWYPGLTADWSADWIDADDVQAAAASPGEVYRPAVYLRHPFTVDAKQVDRAVVYATAAGLYELSVNGRRVGRDYLAPGWTEYGTRMYYQAYDVTDLVRAGGPNAIGVTLGDGWFGLHHNGRGRLAARVQLMVYGHDGSVQRVVTDPTWRASADGPIRTDDIYNGETYDARREMPGWDTADFDDRGWRPVSRVVDRPPVQPKDVADAVRKAIRPAPAGGDGVDRLALKVTNDALGGDPFLNQRKALAVRYAVDGRPPVDRTLGENETLRVRGHGLTVESATYYPLLPPDVTAAVLQPHPGVPVRQTGELRPVAVLSPAPGVTVYDLGQNFTGLARLTVAGAPAGTVVRMRFAEMLKADGSAYTDNLRGARQTDEYTCRGGGGTETYLPRFTFHGFRYVEVTGLPTPPGPDAVVGVVLSSDAPAVGSFNCSDPLLNQLQHNIVWGQRSNYVEVPTDCPQRDERRGWSGDAQAFIPTGTYNQDLAAFFTAWLRSYDDCQAADGSFPDVAPHNVGTTSAGWGDAGVICPWTLYQRYGDTRVLADGYPHMVRWVEYLRTHSHDLIRPALGYGDWLSIRAKTPKDLIATAYFARSTELVSQVAAVLGYPHDAARYADLRRQVGVAFRQKYVTADGHVAGETQTGYLLALGFDLLEPAQRPVAVGRLRQLVHDRQDHLSVGFLGVNLLLPTLADTGDAPLAYTLLENDTYPSWGYPIRQGATTVWERWDGWTREAGFEDVGMNSFNHYAYGSCGQWMYAGVAGLAADAPGFAHLSIAPHVGGGLTFADESFDSIRGRVSVHWGVADDKVKLAVTVPPNVTANVRVPTTAPATVTEGDRPANQSPGVHFVWEKPGVADFELESGHYVFTADAPAAVVTDVPMTGPATLPATGPTTAP